MKATRLIFTVFLAGIIALNIQAQATYPASFNFKFEGDDQVHFELIDNITGSVLGPLP